MLKLLKENKFQFFRAIVTDNKDPKFYGRIKVWIPDLMSDTTPETSSLWAFPANCLFGGGNTQMKSVSKYAGSSYIPLKGQWIWIFLENDNISRIFYFSGLSIENKEITPENTVGSEPWHKWVLFRAPSGRSIWISDDPSDERIFITGKKRKLTDQNAKNSIYPILSNQIVFAIDEKSNKDKVYIADYNNNFINIHSYEDKVYIYASNKVNPGNIYVYTNTCMLHIDDGTKQITVTTDNSVITINNDGTIKLYGNGDISIKSSANIKLTASQIHLNSLPAEQAQIEAKPGLLAGE